MNHMQSNTGKPYLQYDQIVRIEAMSNYSKVYFTNSYPQVFAKVLQWFQEQLPAEKFARVHRSHLVNSAFMLETQKSGNNASLLLSNGDVVAISRRKKSKMLASAVVLLRLAVATACSMLRRSSSATPRLLMYPR